MWIEKSAAGKRSALTNERSDRPTRPGYRRSLLLCDLNKQTADANSISPGWIDTTGSEITGADAMQQPVGRVGQPQDISDLVMFLCSDIAGFITGENICVDGGMTRQMIYHGEHGWTYAPND